MGPFTRPSQSEEKIERFSILHHTKKTPFLDGEYSVFGQTISGMEVVKKIAQGDKITSIEILVK